MCKKILFIITLCSAFAVANQTNFPKRPSPLRFTITADDLASIQEEDTEADIRSLASIDSEADTLSISSMDSTKTVIHISPEPIEEDSNSSPQTTLTEDFLGYENGDSNLDTESQDSTEATLSPSIEGCDKDDSPLTNSEENTDRDLLKQIAEMTPEVSDTSAANANSSSDNPTDDNTDHDDNVEKDPLEGNKGYMDPEKLSRLIQNAKNEELF